MATTYDMKSIAETIRKAQYGKDVREAIAQGFEYLDKRFDSIEKQKEDSDNSSIYDLFGK